MLFIYMTFAQKADTPLDTPLVVKVRNYILRNKAENLNISRWKMHPFSLKTHRITSPT